MTVVDVDRLTRRIAEQDAQLAASALTRMPAWHVIDEAVIDPGDDAFVWRPAAPSAGVATGIERPLAGVRLAVKDNIGVAGAPTRAGTRTVSFDGGEAPVVTALRDLGAVVVGTTTMQELALGDRSAPTRNPRDPTRGCGGSSSGSAAAVAAGHADLALGTDTGGSVRLPAALCGVVGFKPSRRALPVAGVVPLAWTLDTVGLLSGRVELVERAMSGLTGLVAVERRWDGARVGVVPELEADLDPPVAAAYQRALDALRDAGAQIVTLAAPWLDDVVTASAVVIAVEAATAHGALVESGLVGADVARRLTAGTAYAATNATRAHHVLAAAAEAVAAWGRTTDVIVTPTVPTVAWPYGDDPVPATVRGRWVRSSVLWNAAGAPAVTVPVPGPNLPTGVQLAGPAGADMDVLGRAAALEALVA